MDGSTDDGDPVANPIGWMIDLEIALAKAFGWSLWEIDETDIESLVGFVNRFTAVNGVNGYGTDQRMKTGRGSRKYCDQVDWL